MIAVFPGMTSSERVTSESKPRMGGFAWVMLALSAAIVLLVCYLFVRNTHRTGEDVRSRPGELPDTVSPDRAHGTR